MRETMEGEGRGRSGRAGCVEGVEGLRAIVGRVGDVELGRWFSRTSWTMSLGKREAKGPDETRRTKKLCQIESPSSRNCSLMTHLHSVIAPIPSDHRVKGEKPSSSSPLRIFSTRLTDVPASEHLADRSNDLVPDVLLNDSDVLGGERMLPHEGVHSGEEVGRRRRGESAKKGRGEVIADSASNLGKRVGRAGSYEDDVGPATKLRGVKRQRPEKTRVSPTRRDRDAGRANRPRCEGSGRRSSSSSERSIQGTKFKHQT